MSVRTKQEILEAVSKLGIEGDGVTALMEDISDSFVEGGVSRDEYDKMAKERDDAKKSADDYRQRYIDRFYKNYDSPDSKGYINSTAEQETIEKDEKDITYEDLFE